MAHTHPRSLSPTYHPPPAFILHEWKGSWPPGRRTRPGERAMVFIWGSKDQWEYLGMVPVACPSCSRTPCALYQAKTKFTVYWIPTVTLGSSCAAVCPHCRRQWDIDKQTGE